MTAAERWRSNWRVVSAAGAVPVDLRVGPRWRRRTTARQIRALPPGTAVTLRTAWPGARRRCRSFAADAAIAIDREYLAFPTAAAPAYLVEDAPVPARVFVETVLVAPPRARLSAAIDVGFGLLRAVGGGRLLRLLAPGRIAVGCRS